MIAVDYYSLLGRMILINMRSSYKSDRRVIAKHVAFSRRVLLLLSRLLTPQMVC